MWLALLACSFARADAVAQTAASAPACPVANAPGRTISAARPAYPPAALQQGIGGRVIVTITLDAQSRVTAAAIAQSPSPLLNDAALAAARASQFQTAIRDCVPVGDTFNFIVMFQAPGTAGAAPTVAPAALSRYLLGAWSCATQQGSTVVKLFAFNAAHTELIGSNAYANGNVFGMTTEDYSEADGKLDATTRGAYDFAGASTGWQGDALVFDGTGTIDGVSKPQRMTYQRSDPDHFVRTFADVPADGAPVVTSVEQCGRIPAPAFHS